MPPPNHSVAYEGKQSVTGAYERRGDRLNGSTEKIYCSLSLSKTKDFSIDCFMPVHHRLNDSML